MSTEEVKKAPLTNAERQKRFRENKLASALKEVRGIYASKENAKKIKAFADGLD